MFNLWLAISCLLPCPKKSDKMWTLSELSELSESIVQKESFPSARCLRQKAERGRAGFKREGGEGRGSSYRRRRIGAHPASAPSAAWERGCVALLVRLRRGFVILKSFRFNMESFAPFFLYMWYPINPLSSFRRLLSSVLKSYNMITHIYNYTWMKQCLFVFVCLWEN